MKVTFVYPIYENLGLEYLSAVLKERGYETELVLDPLLFHDTVINSKILAKMFDYQDKIIKEVIESKPDVIAFSVMTDTYLWACNFASELKKKLPVPIIFGGIHPTLVPEEVIKNEFVDYVILGESEYAFVELLENLKRRYFRIRNVIAKENGRIIKNPPRDLISNLDNLPFPDKGLYYHKYPYIKKGFYTIMTSRGCPDDCSYCNVSFLKEIYKGKGKFSRRRSPANVIKELKISKEKYDSKYICFYDEIFTSDLQWLRDFCIKYKEEVGLPFFCWIHPMKTSKEIIDLLKFAGCTHVQMSIQVFCESTRKEILKTSNNAELISKTISRLKEKKIVISVDNIIGISKQSEKHYIELVKFYSGNQVEFMNVYWLKYYPNTRILKFLKEKDIQKKSFKNKSERITGDVYNTQIAAIFNSFYFSKILPKNVFNKFISLKLYNHVWLLNNFFVSQIFFFTTILFKRRKFLPIHRVFFRRYLFFGLKNLYIRFFRKFI